MKVFLHIGAPRTGTTSLQSLLTANRAKLAAAGLDYPALGLLHPVKGVAQHKLSFSLLPVWPAFAIQAKCTPTDAWGELRAHMHGSTKTLFLSSETFSSLDERGVEYVADFFKGCDVTAIYVRRDPLEWRRSMREQWIVAGVDQPDLPTHPARDLTEQNTAQWKRRFPVHIIDYGPDCHREIMSLAGFDYDALDPVERRNAKIPDDVLDLLAKLNKIPMAEQNRVRFNEEIIDYLGRKTL